MRRRGSGRCRGWWRAVRSLVRAFGSGQPRRSFVRRPTVWAAARSLGVLDHLEADAMLGRRFFGRLARIALIDIGHLDMFARDVLNLADKFADLGSVLLIGWGNAQRQQVAQRVDCRIHLRALPPLGSVVASPCAGLRRGLD